MNILKKHLRENYQISNYQIAQIQFLFKTLFSEISKMLIMGIIFHQRLNQYLFALCILLFLRTTTGGMHFYTYTKCLASSVLFMWLALYALPKIMLPTYILLSALFGSIFICYSVGPVVSKYRLEPSPERSRRFRNITCVGILAYILALYGMPENRYLIIGFWVVILHSLQLLLAKIRKKGVYRS